MRRIIALAAFFIFPFSATPASAWGCDGHQAVAMVAERLLNPSVLKKMEAVLTGSPANPALKPFCSPVSGDPIAEASTWADDYRALAPATGGWHFINFPIAVGPAVSDYRAYCPQGNCVIDAIVTQYRILTTTSDRKMKADALRFLIHFVGDLHQPMHAATNGDRGGNCFPIAFHGEVPVEDERHNFRPNLHSVWDDGMLHRLMNTRRLSNSRALADYVAGGAPTPVVGPEMPTAARVASWANESYALARTVAYGALPVKPPVESARALTLSSCQDNNRVGARIGRLGEDVRMDYEQAGTKVIVDRIRLAGQRLAAIMKAAFAG